MSGFWNKKRVLITGISGFVGPYLARALVEQDAEVHGVLRMRADRSLSRGLSDETLTRAVTLREGDLEALETLLKVIGDVRPDVVFHLGAQSFVRQSFDNPMLFARANGLGTANLLEAVRLRAPEATFVFAGSSEQYGLVFASASQYEDARRKYGAVFPAPERLPELPVRETNPLRPMSPYGASKVYGDFLVRNYACSFGVKGIVSRAFNHEGAGRGITFVTSQIASQVVRLALGEAEGLALGDVNSFRDWSHVRDIVRGYMTLAERGVPGEVYNQGSMRTNSVLSYALLALEEVGWDVRGLRTLRGGRTVDRPTETRRLRLWDTEFEATRIDELMLTEGLAFTPEDEGLLIATSRGDVRLAFDRQRFRPSEVPVLLCDASRGRAIGCECRATLRDVLRDQITYYRVPQNRAGYTLS